MTVRDNLDRYEGYVVREEDIIPCVLLCLYLDASSFANRGEAVSSSVETTYYKTTNKKLKAWYNPNFKASLP